MTIAIEASCTVTGSFSLQGQRLAFKDLTGEGPAGQCTGTASFGPQAWKLALNVARMNQDVVRWMLPGTVGGGLLSGTNNLAGPAADKLKPGDLGKALVWAAAGDYSEMVNWLLAPGGDAQ